MKEYAVGLYCEEAIEDMSNQCILQEYNCIAECGMKGSIKSDGMIVRERRKTELERQKGRSLWKK